MERHEPPPLSMNLLQILEENASSRPDETFLMSVDDGDLTWREMKRAVVDWTQRLTSASVKPGQVVANLTDAGLGSVCQWLSLCQIGAIECAVNTAFRGRLLAYAIGKTSCEVMIVDPAYLGLLEEISDQIGHVRTIILLNGDGSDAPKLRNRIVHASDLADDVDCTTIRLRSPEWHEIACITYTSGTTGPSKAVRLPWAQLHAVNTGVYPFGDLGAHDVIYSLSTNAHFGSKSTPYLAAMLGARVVMRRRYSATQFWADVEAYGITTAAFTSSMAEVLLRDEQGPGPDNPLRNVFMAPIIPDYRRFNERFGTRICTVYNSTEGGIAIHSGWDPDDWRSCGRLRSDPRLFDVRIVDQDDWEVPDGTMGECVIRPNRPWAMNAGYLNDGDATATAWRNGWFHTGDGLIRSESGDYYFVDRIKDSIRRRGENISSFEVEAEVMVNPDVAECAAVAVPAAEGEDEILLYVIPKQGTSLTPDNLAEDLLSRMTKFMVPRFYAFVGELPRTEATFRVKKADLRKAGLPASAWDRLRKQTATVAGGT